MNDANFELAQGLVSRTYVRQGAQGIAARQNLVKTLLSQRRLPQKGWDDQTIEMLLKDCALMDSNNFVDNVGVGEREARVASALVHRRNFGLAHGAGRSGDIAAEQPKAAGSSLLMKLTELLVKDALGIAGMGDLGAAAVLPLATGMALTLVLLSLKAKRPATARYAVWPRIDQKTCVKAIATAGLELVVVEERREEGGQLVTDLGAVEAAIERLGADNVCCVVSTTSCFAPRSCDDIVGLAKLCERRGVGHVVNNAYGVQSAAICKQISGAWRRGRVDAVVQSTDKNFMVPVGGAVVCAGARDPSSLVAAVTSSYPGRASSAPAVDLLITLLHWGAAGWRRALADREDLYPYLRDRMRAAAAEVGETVVETPGNPISVAMTLDTIEALAAEAAEDVARQQQAGRGEGEGGAEEVDGAAAVAVAVKPSPVAGGATFFGSMLFQKCVSGTRVVPRGKRQTVAGTTFLGYGSHVDAYPHAYLTAAAAIGSTREDVDEFAKRLLDTFKAFKKKAAKASKAARGGAV